MSHTAFPAVLRDPQWFVLFVRSNQEKKTAQRLAGYQIEHFLPCCRSLRQWKDRRVTLEVPLFPSYVFVRLPLIERARVLSLPHVVSLLGTKNAPSAVSEEEIAWIRRSVEYGEVAPHPYLTVGQRVIITTGILSGMQGILVRKQSKTRVVVALDSIARAFVVEVDPAWVEPLDQPWPMKQAV